MAHWVPPRGRRRAAGAALALDGVDGDGAHEITRVAGARDVSLSHRGTVLAPDDGVETWRALDLPLATIRGLDQLDGDGHW